MSDLARTVVTHFRAKEDDSLFRSNIFNRQEIVLAALDIAPKAGVLAASIKTFDENYDAGNIPQTHDAAQQVEQAATDLERLAAQLRVMSGQTKEKFQLSIRRREARSK